jgi:hypothetical protein
MWDFKILFMIMMLMEAFRRLIWCIIFVENETVTEIFVKTLLKAEKSKGSHIKL